MLIPTKKFMAFALILALLWPGCAGSKDTLVLDSVMSERQRKEYLKAQKALMTTQSLEAWKTAMSASTLNTPELELLELSPSFSRLSDDEMMNLKSSGLISVPPFCEIVWKDFDRNIYIMAGKVPWDANYLTSKTRDEFKKVLEEKIATTYQGIHEKESGMGAATSLRENGKMLILEIVNKHLENNEWHADERYFYIYKPDYRLNVFIKGKDKLYEPVADEVRTSLMLFEEKLNRVFPEDIPFKDQKSA